MPWGHGHERAQAGGAVPSSNALEEERTWQEAGAAKVEGGASRGSRLTEQMGSLGVLEAVRGHQAARGLEPGAGERLEARKSCSPRGIQGGSQHPGFRSGEPDTVGKREATRKTKALVMRRTRPY